MEKTKEQTAIGILWQQHDKLNPPGGHLNAFGPWVTQTQSLIRKYFGENSDEYNYIKPFYFRARVTTDDEFGHKIWLAQKFLKDCIETLEIKPVYKEPKKNFLQSVDDKSLAAWILGIGAVIFGGGKFQERFEHQNDMQIIKEQQQTLKIKSDSITNLRTDNQLLIDTLRKYKKMP